MKPETVSHPDDEPVEVVDAAGRPMAVVSAGEAHRQFLPHKAVLALFFDREARLILEKRDALAQAYPGRWDLPGRAHVWPGEAFFDVAHRLGETLFPGRCEELLSSLSLPASRETSFEALCVFRCRLAATSLVALESAPAEKREFLAVNAGEMAALAADFRELFAPGVIDALHKGWLFGE